ncbi:MAG TPA: D-Ala-D-Ala carboxypeptidase family metallohydrolase [Hyphomicrobiaceae bacterium]|nr:D-Ala-D-Ala carboxypeptidase family metallohydrolase [Hyphomicrobiaceae bacterium]
MAMATSKPSYGVSTVSVLMALSIMVVMAIHLAAPAHARTGDDTAKPRPRDSARGVQVASLGDVGSEAAARHRDDLSRGAAFWRASPGCLNPKLRGIVGKVAKRFGPVMVNSTCRSARRNAAVGGAHRSYHIGGHAVDFSVKGNARAVHAFLRDQKSVGGLKFYGSHFHIDTGPRRTW